MRPFLIGAKANWCLPYLDDASNIPSIRWYISLETRLIHGIFDWKRGRIGNRPSIKLSSTRGRLAIIHEWTKKWRSRLSEDEVAEFLTKTARDKCKNTQNISLVDKVLLDLRNSFHPTQPHSLIAKYVTTEHSKIALVYCLSLARWQLNNIVIFCFPQFDFLSNIAFSMWCVISTISVFFLTKIKLEVYNTKQSSYAKNGCAAIRLDYRMCLV